MPRLEAYEQQITAQPAQGGSVPIESFTGVWKTATETFGSIDESVKQFEKLRNENDVLKAETDYKLQLAQIQSEADQDNDPANATKYKARIDEAMQNSIKNINAPELKNRASEAFRLSGYTAYSNIQNKFNKQIIEQAQDNLFKSIEASRQEYIATTDGTKKKSASMSALDSINRGVQAGYLTAESARALREEVAKDWVNGEAAFDAHSNPDMFIEEATKPGGRFESLEDKVKWLDYAENRKIKIKKEQEDALIEQNNKTKSEQLAKGDDLTPEDVNIAIANGVYKTPQEAETFMKFAINGVQVDAKTDSGIYTELMSDLYSLGKRGKKEKEITDSSKTASDINNFRIKARQANLDKKLSDVDYRDFIDGTQKVFDKKVREEIEKQKGGWENFKNWLGRVNDDFEGDVNARKAEYLAEFNRRTIIGGESQKTVTDDIQLRAATEKYPWLAGKKIGDQVENKFGKKRIFKGMDNGKPMLEDIK